MNYAHVDAKDNVKVTSTNGNIDVSASTVNAKAGDASIIANKGKVDIREIVTTNVGSTVEAGNNVTVEASGDVTINRSDVIAGSDKEGFDVTKDANDTIGDAIVTSKNGSVNIKNNSKVISQDKDVKITAKNDIKFGNKNTDNIDQTADITAKDNVKITSTAGDITGEKTTMPTIKYGERLTFDAAKNNIFTSKDSLKSVNVDYIAGESNRFYTEGDNQFVNSTLKAPNNFVESGKDVILNNLEIKQATDKPEDTVTEIYANGNVTTQNVTGENLGAKDAGDYYTYPQSVSADRVARDGKTLEEYNNSLEKTPLDINQTKLKVITDTVKDDNNPDNGSITLVLHNADNPNAGIELEANNVDSLGQDPTDGYFEEGYYKTGTNQWDKNSEVKEGPEVHIKAQDTTEDIAVSKIVTDKLFIDDETMPHIIPSKVDLTPEEKEHVLADGDPQGYIQVRDYKGFNQDTDFDNPQPEHFTYTEDGGEKVITPGGPGYPDHTIEIGDNGPFTLVYDRPAPCDDPEDPGRGPSTALPSTDDVSLVTLPREQLEVQDNTADQTSNIMSAAARVDLGQEIDGSYEDEDENDDLD